MISLLLPEYLFVIGYSLARPIDPDVIGWIRSLPPTPRRREVGFTRRVGMTGCGQVGPT